MIKDATLFNQAKSDLILFVMIIEEWLSKAKLMKSGPEAFLLPPFQLKYKLMFYKALIKKVFRFI